MKLHDQNQAMVLAGRILVALIFIGSGINKIFGWNETQASIESHGVPLAPLFLLASILIEVSGGVSVLMGLRARAGAAILALYLIPVSMLYHGFWMLNGIDRQLQMVNFLKNLAIIGGLVQIIARGAGYFSLDYWLSRKNHISIERGKDHIRAVS